MNEMSSTHGNQKATDEDILDAIRNVNEPVASASEIAETLSMTRTGVTARLKQLEDEGVVKKKSVGNGYVWWVAH